MPRRMLVIYDGECRFCRFGIGVIGRLDRRGTFEFCPFGHPKAEERLSVLEPERRYESMHVEFDDALYSGTDAARLMLRELPFGPIAVMLGFHRAYPLVARYRWFLGRLSPQRRAPVTCRDEEKAPLP